MWCNQPFTSDRLFVCEGCSERARKFYSEALTFYYEASRAERLTRNPPEGDRVQATIDWIERLPGALRVRVENPTADCPCCSQPGSPASHIARTFTCEACGCVWQLKRSLEVPY